MSTFIQHTGIVLPLDIANIDTDNIIPKQFLQETTRANFKKYLFFNWRFLNDKNNTINSNFILNKPQYKNASILLVRKNFGCGSSREHAVWSLVDYGFKIIIAPSFSDIFYKNCLNNRLLPAILSELETDSLFKEINKQKQQNIILTITINLYKKIIYTKHKKYFFKISDYHKNYLINNIDNIHHTLQHDAIIKAYENNQLSFLK